jgi:hypothetical protein
MQVAVEEVVHKEVDPLKTADLDAYLNRLEQRARENHKVSALELQPGMEAIRRLVPADQYLDRSMAFGRRMAALSASLVGDGGT